MLIVQGLERYPSDQGLTRDAARLYAQDKGLSALPPLPTVKDYAARLAWQLGVVEVAARQFLLALLAAR